MARVQGEFAGVLRGLRGRAQLTQQEMAEAAGVSPRTISNLERGVGASPQRETVRLLGDALGLIGLERMRFEAAARGRPLDHVPAAAATRSLPRDVASFTGRQRELRHLVESAVSGGGVVSIHAIGGMAGVGKTAFAVHAAHHLASRFPGGQIFLPLHGHTPGRRPVDPADALASLLLTIGFPPAQVPSGLAARAALWRDQAADKPLLLVLDDAEGTEQVQPLLPGAGGSLVLVTSRRHLSALDHTTAISLDTLPPGDAAALLVRLAGRPGLSPHDPGVREISRLCGFLPLAVGMMARQLRHHPVWSAAGRAAELAAARDRLGMMKTENLSVAAAFDLSYAQLSGHQQRLFRGLGLHPGDDFDGYVAAALSGSDLSGARQGLERLYDQHLLTEVAQGRYRLHDLLREHARALAERLDPKRERDAATARLLDYYQHGAAAAEARTARWSRPRLAADADVPVAVPALDSQEQALAWLRAERASLLACIDYAGSSGQLARVVGLTAGMSGLFLQDGPFVDAVTRHTAAVQAAQQLGDPLSQANALSDLGNIQRWMNNYPAAVRALEEALDLYRSLDVRLGQASTRVSLGAVFLVTGDHVGAGRMLEEALALCRDLGDQRAEADALASLGRMGMVTGDYPAAVRALEEALGLYRGLGVRLGQATTLSNLGFVLRLTGDYPAARRAQEEALDVARDLGDRLLEATTLSGLGIVLRTTGDYPGAARAQEKALDIVRDLGNRRGQANALAELGMALRLMGDYPAAARALDEALGITRDIGDRGGEAEGSNERGALHRMCGEVTLARKCHQRSLELSREIDSAWDEAHALAGLGRCARSDGDAEQAEGLLRQALEIFQRIGAAEASEVHSELEAVVGQRPAP